MVREEPAPCSPGQKGNKKLRMIFPQRGPANARRWMTGWRSAAVEARPTNLVPDPHPCRMTKGCGALYGQTAPQKLRLDTLSLFQPWLRLTRPLLCYQNGVDVRTLQECWDTKTEQPRSILMDNENLRSAAKANPLEDE